ncbi:MAG: hypothetical protein ACFFDW_12145 [Candidatus Thorarchaeota archaeon]
MNTKKLLIGLTLISLFLIPAGTQFASAANEQIGVGEVGGAITISTEEMTIKVTPGQAQIMWWYGNKSNNDEMYKLQLVKIQEFQGDDGTLDDRNELGGIAYNLITEDWEYLIDEGDTELTITLSLEGLANGANIYLIMHVYNVDEPINGTNQVVDGLTEMKFDIIIENWDFTPTAAGVGIQTYMTEVQHRHRVEVRNGTVAENGNTTRTMQFTSDEYADPVAYVEWATFADVYNSTDDLIDTIEVGTAYFDDLASPPTEAPGFAEGLGHLWLTYPNYGDNYKLVHDPLIGINEDAFTATAPIYWISILGGLFAVGTTFTLIKKRRN